MEARCQCGLVHFTTPQPTPLKVYICHCIECRYQSSSAFGISAMFPAFSLPTLQSATDDAKEEGIKVYTRTADSGRQRMCYFCSRCGSRLVHATEGVKVVSVKGGCLEGLTREMINEATHIWTKRAVVPIPEGVESYEEEPPYD